MKNQLFKNMAAALVVAAVAAPLAQATDSYDGYKSSYPQLHAGLSHQIVASPVANSYEGYKSSYPQLHAGLTHQIVASPVANSYEGYKSSYPRLHAVLVHQVQSPVIRAADRAFHWSDAAVGAGVAALAIFLLAAGALILNRRQTGVPV
jgi:hypothetical protein